MIMSRECCRFKDTEPSSCMWARLLSILETTKPLQHPGDVDLLTAMVQH